MTTIILPTWSLISLLALSIVVFLGCVIRHVLQRRRKDRKPAQEVPIRESGPIHLEGAFQQDLYALQIDAVFNALAALIETERLKLKSLLCPTVPYVPEACVSEPYQTLQPNAGERSEPRELDELIAERVALGESVGEIASALDLSQSEVELAISMNPGQVNGDRRRLEAVA